MKARMQRSGWRSGHPFLMPPRARCSFRQESAAMVDPVRNKKHGNGDRNDDEVAKLDRHVQDERDRKVREDEKEMKKESRRDTGTG
jgi:hypothetical protein